MKKHNFIKSFSKLVILKECISPFKKSNGSKKSAQLIFFGGTPKFQRLNNFILQSFNKCIIGGKFPDQLKKADVSPVFKKGNHNDKTNYRSVKILTSLSKINDCLIYNQINQMTENALSIFQCSFRKKYSTQHALIAMIEKAKKILDKGGRFGGLLTDLSKAFDCMTHDLLIAKLHALNFGMNALNLTFDYLTGRKQRVKINSRFSS